MSDDLLNDLFEIGHDDITDVQRSNFVRAPFGWFGGKTQSLKYIMPKLPIRKKWVEHFGGSGVISWNRSESPVMIYNDRYSGVVAFYRCLQSNKYKQLIERLEYLTPPHSREEWLHARSSWVTEIDDVERAAKWFYMIKLSVINKGKAFGRGTNSKTTKLPSGLELFEPIHNKLKAFTLENLDWRVCIKDYDSHDCVHYFDPPYVDSDQSGYDHKFSKTDLDELLYTISKMKGFVALSGYPNDHIDHQSYWTERIEFELSERSEVQAFTETNRKQDFQHVAVGTSREVLWIKEHA